MISINDESPLSMHGSLFKLYNLLFCADVRPEPDITTRYACFACAGHVTSNNLSVIPWVMLFRYFYQPVTCYLLDILVIKNFYYMETFNSPIY
jgi:hypothetical protein